MTQGSLALSKPSADAAVRLAPAMYRILALWPDRADAHKWFSGAYLRATLGTNERVIREIAAQSQGAIISGQRGYKLTKYATVEECDHAERWLRSQARQMLKRAIQIRKARNAGGRG